MNKKLYYRKSIILEEYYLSMGIEYSKEFHEYSKEFQLNVVRSDEINFLLIFY